MILITPRTRTGIFDSLLIGFVVLASWTYFYWNWLAAGVPVGYAGDALGVLARLKAHADGELWPILPNHVASLNAPFNANWNDYPFEDMVYFPGGILVWLFGLARGTHAYLAILQIMAGLSFYVSGRLLSYDRKPVIAGAILFGLAPYAWHRNLGHLTLTVYWHLPLLLVSALWLLDPEKVRCTRKQGLAGSAIVSAIAGMLNPYYLYVYVFLAGMALLGRLRVRNYRSALDILICFGAAGLGVFSAHADTFVFGLTWGKNSMAVQRSFSNLDHYGLRLPDLFFPFAHRIKKIQDSVNHLYFQKIPVYLQGESQSAYFGLVPLVGFAWLLLQGILDHLTRRTERVSPWFWPAVLVIALGIAGGMNYLIGSLGFIMFRATNRFSIVLMAIALLFLCERISSRTLPRWTGLLFVSIVLFGILDQMPHRWSRAMVEPVRLTVVADQQVARDLENILPSRAMVFQLPVKGFPETGNFGTMSDYEHFRPYLFSKTLRWSYGTVKGRGDADWQRDVEALPVPQMNEQLERYGFSAVMINRKAYEDYGAGLDQVFRTAGCPVLADRGDLLVFGLEPSGTPELPPVPGPRW